jgi:hypothetical protein
MLPAPWRRLGRRLLKGGGVSAALLGGVAVATLGGVPARAELPPEDQCPTFSGTPGARGPKQDATPTRLREGMLLSYQDVLLLRTLLPIEVWRNRESFFHDGMRLEIGACHRRYPVPPFFAAASEKFGGQATLDADGNLRGHVAGLPFPPKTLDPPPKDIATRWAWNFERRYRGAGFSGKFRLTDMPTRVGGIQTYLGRWSLVQTAYRADLPESDYRIPQGAGHSWISAGEFYEPTSARHLAWRQLRPLETAERYSISDDTFVYVPTMRKVRRAASGWVDGHYTPRYRISGDAGGGGVLVGMDQGALNPTSSESAAATENLRRGFEGLSIRPNAYNWRVLGEREVLAPINVTRSGYPKEANRNFGPSGLSVGSDRWDVRYAVVIQGSLKERGRDFDLLTLFVDYQTQQPLYVITKKRQGGRLVEVGILLHRFSGDQMRYPRWPSGEAPHVFDPVGAVFFDASDGASGWRRESYGGTSLPLSKADLDRITTLGTLERSH